MSTPTKGEMDRVVAERDAAMETLERWHKLNLQREEKVYALQQRADLLFSALLAPEYLAPGCWVTGAQEGDWFIWNSESRPINKHALCDVILRDGRILLNRSPYDFDWSRGGEVLIARQCVGTDADEENEN